MNAPVLLIIYKRPDLTRRALEAIAASRPSRLFVAADGPGRDQDSEACRLARETVDTFTDCEVVRNFSDVNLGCGIRVHTAIDWAFTMTDELIVLEDDCLPIPSFFSFCNEMLARYRDDTRIMHISGDNFVGSPASGPDSYYYSKYAHAWGWATWKRAWRHFDWSISQWPALRNTGFINQWCSDPLEQRYWIDIFDRMHGGADDVWDYMWTFACWSQSGLTIIPAVNLVQNEGWGPEATHTHDPFEMPPPTALEVTRHPDAVIRNLQADELTFDRNYGGAHLRAMDSPRARFRRRVDPFLGPARFVKRTIRHLLRAGS